MELSEDVIDIPEDPGAWDPVGIGDHRPQQVFSSGLVPTCLSRNDNQRQQLGRQCERFCQLSGEAGAVTPPRTWGNQLSQATLEPPGSLSNPESQNPQHMV